MKKGDKVKKHEKGNKVNIELKTKALSLIFQPTDAIYLCGQLSGDKYSDPRVTTINNFSALPSHRQFCINPLTRRGNTDGSIRAQVNIAAYRNFLFESDTVALEVQRALVPKLLQRLPIRLATYSGSKSVHYIFSLADDLSCGIPGTPESVLMYKQYWEGLRQALEAEMVALAPELLEQPKLLDLSTKDPIKLSRLPYANRDGVVQEVLGQGRLILSEDVYDYATKVERAAVGPITTADPNMSLATFEKLLKARSSYLGLRTKMEMTYKWASDSGMYHEMFKLALWASDLTGVPHKTFDMYCQTHVYPIIKAKGYVRDPSIGVFNAYKWKNLV